MTNHGNGENPNGAALFEAANKLRGSVESAEYKHLVLGLIFLKYISDSFDLRREQLEAELADPESDAYIDDRGPSGRRSSRIATSTSPRTSSGCPRRRAGTKLLAAASQPDIAQAHRRRAGARSSNENPRLRNVLPRIYSRAPLSAELMGSLVETIAKIGFGKDAEEARDILGRTYEYFIKEFARAEGHRGGEFFTPAPVARLLVEMLEPFEGRVFDPACGSCGLFIQSGRVHRGPRRQPRQDLDLRPGAQPGDMADRPDEPRHPRSRRATSSTPRAARFSTTRSRRSRRTS